MGSVLATSPHPVRRLREEEECTLRSPFQRDRDRIIHCKAFRRLKHKTQVFVAPEGDHYRTRLTHTLEATMISRTVARALALNEDLVEAIGLGHDVAGLNQLDAELAGLGTGLPICVERAEGLPVERLFLASASAHPGGGVHGAPGANAARAALARDRALTGKLYQATISAAHRAIYR